MCEASGALICMLRMRGVSSTIWYWLSSLVLVLVLMVLMMMNMDQKKEDGPSKEQDRILVHQRLATCRLLSTTQAQTTRRPHTNHLRSKRREREFCDGVETGSLFSVTSVIVLFEGSRPRGLLQTGYGVLGPSSTKSVFSEMGTIKK